MDEREQESWTVKAERIRTERRAEQKNILSSFLADQDQNAPSVPKRLLDVAAESIPTLGLAWREIFNEYWKARDPSDIESLKNAETEAIGNFFDEEIRKAKDEVRKMLTGPAFAPVDEARLENASSQLVARCSEVRPQCQALVNRLAAESSRERVRVNRERHWRLAEVLAVSILSAIGSALVAQYSHSLSEKESQEQLSALKAHVQATQDVAQRLSERVTVLNKISPPFALVDEAGKIVYQDDRFKKYGLAVTVSQAGENEGSGWRYRFKFTKPPHAVTLLSQKGAVPSRTDLSKTEMDVRFVSVGFGNRTVQSESIVQILEP
jgi:type II secretory pathway pseudopilin PulG